MKIQGLDQQAKDKGLVFMNENWSRSRCRSYECYKNQSIRLKKKEGIYYCSNLLRGGLVAPESDTQLVEL